MEQFNKQMAQPDITSKSEINFSIDKAKAAHLSSNPINGSSSDISKAHFEVEVEKAFFRIFFGR